SANLDRSDEVRPYKTRSARARDETSSEEEEISDSSIEPRQIEEDFMDEDVQPSPVKKARVGAGASQPDCLLLEAYDEATRAWYDVQILELRRSKARVLFENVEPVEKTWIPIHYLRVRSDPCEMNLTRPLRVGAKVLAFRVRKDDALYFDAVIERIKRKKDKMAAGKENRCKAGAKAEDNEDEEIPVDGNMYKVKYQDGPVKGRSEWLLVHQLLKRNFSPVINYSILCKRLPDTHHVCLHPLIFVGLSFQVISDASNDESDFDLFKGWMAANTETLPSTVARKLTAISHSGDEQVSNLFACRLVHDGLQVVDEILSFRVAEKNPKKGDGKADVNAREYFVILCRSGMTVAIVKLNGSVARRVTRMIARLKKFAVGGLNHGEVLLIVLLSKYLVKWCGCSYEKCTWEDESSLDSPGDREKVKEFQAAQARYVKRSKQQKGSEKKPVTAYHEIFESPSYLNGALHDYQIRGLNWLRKKRFDGENVILADEMGLGKTIQIASLIASVMVEEKRTCGPFLIVVPLSTIANWKREIQKWCPDVNFAVLHDSQKGRQVMIDHEFDPLKLGVMRFEVLCTSYEVAVSAFSALSKVRWDTLIVDEGHRLKNDESILYAQLQKLQTKNKILLTGTPLQNNLNELFNLMIRMIHKLFEPYILRRLKKDVKIHLKAKVEKTVPISLTDIQKTFYAAILAKNLDVLNGRNKDNRHVSLNNVLMELRKCCNHAYLFDSAVKHHKNPDDTLAHLVQASGKFELLHLLLPKLKERGSKVLIFSQFKIMLDILETYLELFNNPESEYFIFLLSTRAGGQALSRAHRIGQKNNVLVLRLVTINTVEEKVISQARKKLMLESLVVGANQECKFSRKETELWLMSVLLLMDYQEILLYGAKQIVSDDQKLKSTKCSRVLTSELRALECETADDTSRSQRGACGLPEPDQAKKQAYAKTQQVVRALARQASVKYSDTFVDQLLQIENTENGDSFEDYNESLKFDFESRDGQDEGKVDEQMVQSRMYWNELLKDYAEQEKEDDVLGRGKRKRSHVSYCEQQM
ncbi:hypothetical protein GUITHDRAFT_149568, partial [Guillardia theta CCMP2712]